MTARMNAGAGRLRHCLPRSLARESALISNTRNPRQIPGTSFACLRATTDRPCPKSGRWGEFAAGSRRSHTSAVPSAGRDKLPGVQARASLVPPLAARVGVTIEFPQAFKL